MTLCYSQLQTQTTFRPEQFALQDELKLRHIPSELENGWFISLDEMLAILNEEEAKS